MFGLLILLALAIPVSAVVAIVLAVGTRERLQRLEFRLAGVEARLAGLAAHEAPPMLDELPSTPVSISLSGPEPKPTGEGEEPPHEPEAGIAPKAAATAAKPHISLEERFGTQWVVWVGGIALAFGGFFLVRYSIEQGWFGPGARIVLGALLAGLLIAAGEWTRRTEIHTGVVGLSSAHIPSVLTAAGTTVAFADVYAAYALYGFLGPAAAFLLLGVVALCTLAAALLHGPALAGLGLVGAFVTPLIVATDQPNYWALYLYLAVVTAAAFALARARLWRWLAITAVIFGLVWTLPGIADTSANALTPHVFHVVIGFLLAAALIVSGFLFGPDRAPGRIDGVSSGALGAYLLGAAFLVLASRHDTLALLAFALLVAATLAIAWRSDAATAAVPAAALLVALVFLQWTVDLDVGTLGLPASVNPGALWEPDRYPLSAHLVLGVGLALLFGAAGFLVQGRFERPLPAMLWAASAVFTPIAILVMLYYRIADFDRSIPFAGTAVLLAGCFAAATEGLGKRAARPGTLSATAIFATGAIASLALALTMALEKGWLTVALALMVPGIAWVAERRPLPALRWIAAAAATLVLARIAWDPRIMGDAIGTTPIFNWLLYGYGVPAAAFWLAGHRMRKVKDDTPVRIVDAAALLFTVLLFFFEIRHTMTGGDPYASTSDLAEIALQVCMGLAIAIGLERIRLRSHSIVHNVGAVIIAALTLIGIVLGLGFVANPMLWPEQVGGPVLNLILLGYGLPAVLAGVLALVTMRPKWYSTTAGIVAVALALGYLTLEVTRLYHGPVLTEGVTSDAEQYTYSAVWLAFGVALLAAGIVLGSLPLRLASAVVVLLTVVKVFLVDMSDLTGIYQALSFLGLGAVLIGIGWFYQRLLFPRAAPSSPISAGGDA
jgi:uncharacterized membrane protein